jgi:glycosyltransferase involved in cell wall biosynthesis
MRIVLCHNYYQQPGGEDRVFADEAQLLSSRGHDVVTFTRHNESVCDMGPWSLAAQTLWNRQAATELERVVRAHRADIVHFHNTLPLISPATYYAARRAGAAVVQTLHNYRLLCPKATFFRDGGPCESCLGKSVPWPAVKHACYRDDRAASVAVAAMLTFHRAFGTYQNSVDAYIAVSKYSLQKFVSGGLPAEKLHLRPNFILEDPGCGSGGGRYALYLGRLAPEKGIETLLKAWQQHDPGLPLVVGGDGPLATLVEKVAEVCDRILWLRHCPHEQAMKRLGEAVMLIVPSLWYEVCPKTVLEAYAKGTPVIASRLGALAELVLEGRTGECFAPGSAADLAATVRRLRASPRLLNMRHSARQLFETHYAADPSYWRLLDIYNHAYRVRHGRSLPIAEPTLDDALAQETTVAALETVVESVESNGSATSDKREKHGAQHEVSVL